MRNLSPPTPSLIQNAALTVRAHHEALQQRSQGLPAQAAFEDYLLVLQRYVRSRGAEAHSPSFQAALRVSLALAAQYYLSRQVQDDVLAALQKAL
jgi:hypothetical protein